MQEPTEVEPSWHPIETKRAVAKEHYITGRVALNLFDARCGEEGGVADWHDISALWGSKRGRRPEHAGLDMTVPEKTLGLEGVEDARAAFARVGHPAGGSRSTLWKATHTRAIVDMAFHHWKTHGRRPRCVAFYGPISPWTVADWLWTEKQMETLKRYAERAEAEISEQDKHWWRRWWTSLRFGANHEDYPEPDR